MAQKNYMFTSESVTEGHPDKVCDQVSDAILDECIRQDPLSRVGVETVAKTGMILVAGEITTKAYVDIPKIARQTLKEIGYANIPSAKIYYEIYGSYKRTWKVI